MGATVSPIFAEYVMDDLLVECVSSLDFQIPFLKKYVDDIVCAVPENKIEYTVSTFNNYNPHLQFTVEKEDDRKIAFLDTQLIRRHDNSVILDWYRKPTSSGRYINYNSNHPPKMKINLILALKKRILAISHPSLHRKNLNLLYNILLDNSYPPKILKKYIFNTRNTPTNNDNNRNINQDNDTERTVTYGSIPYINDVTPRLISVFKEETGIKIAQKNVKTVGSLYTKLKDKEQSLNKSNVIYRIPCHDCESRYIGQTSRNLKGRITSHKSDIRTGKRTCALSEHVIDTGHFPDFSQVEVLHTEKNSSKRLFLEMTAINKEIHPMNKRTDINNLSLIYNYILDFKASEHENVV